MAKDSESLKNGSEREQMSTWAVAAIGIGSMVGAGIFALLGQAILMAGEQVVLAFIVGGIVAMLAGYSYVKLSIKFPSSGGINAFYMQAFGHGALSATFSLIYAITLIIATAMIAKSFGHYAANVFSATSGNMGVVDVFSALAILGLVWLNSRGAGNVGKLESWLVGIKMGILVILIFAGILLLVRAAPGSEFSPPPAATNLLASVGLIFFAYAGFGMMANCSASVKNPAKQIPIAIYSAIGIVLLIYISLSLIVMKTVSVYNLTIFADTAVAEAARPVLGQVGFFLVSAAAIIATLSAINATIFSLRSLVFDLSTQKSLPSWVKTPVRFFPKSILICDLVIAGTILILALGFDLSTVAQIASATFLISYLLVHVSHWKLSALTGGNRYVIAIGALLMFAVLVRFLLSVGSESMGELLSIPLMIIIVWIGEFFWFRYSKKGNSSS